MKLSDIKKLNESINLTEGVIPVHLTMLLQQIIDNGKITNSVECFTLASLMNMFKNDGPFQWPRELTPYSMVTSTDMIEAVKLLTPEETVDLAQWLLDRLSNVASFESNPWANNSSENTLKWIRWVLSRDDS